MPKNINNKFPLPAVVALTLRKRRMICGFEGRELELDKAADAVELTPTVLGKIERGTKDIVAFPLIARLTRLYGMKMDDLTIPNVEQTIDERYFLRKVTAFNHFDTILSDDEKSDVLSLIEGMVARHRASGKFRSPYINGEQVTREHNIK